MATIQIKNNVNCSKADTIRIEGTSITLNSANEPDPLYECGGVRDYVVIFMTESIIGLNMD